MSKGQDIRLLSPWIGWSIVREGLLVFVWNSASPVNLEIALAHLRAYYP